MGKFTLGYQVLAAVLLAILAGLFFGPLCSTLFKPIALTFTMLLQSMVLPYIFFSLVHGLGALPAATGKKLFKRGWPFFLTIWVLVYLFMMILAELIPKPQETVISLAKTQAQINILDEFVRYIVPANLIYDLSNNIVPAVAIFGVIAGVALMHMQKKEPLTGLLEKIVQILEKGLYWLVIVSPIGAFAHIAIGVGTVQLQDFGKLGFFLVCYIALSLLMTFLILPLLVSSLTPMRFKEVLDAFRKVCLLPFVTGLPAFSIPFLTSYLRTMAKRYEHNTPIFQEASQTILPLAYSFGQIGNCIVLFFLFFLSFFYRHPFTAAQEALLTLLSIPLSIGTNANTINSVDFMIRHLELPPEAFGLFTETAALTKNFQVLMSVAAIFSLILLTIHGMYELLEIKWRMILVRLGTVIAVFCVVTLALKSILNIGDNYANLYKNLRLADVINHPVPSTVYTRVGEGTERNAAGSRLSQILESGVLKVGYSTVDMPFAYLNQRNELVGYDVAYAYQLARDLDCRLEFVPCDFDALSEELQAGFYDVAMSAILMTESRLTNLTFTQPYHEENNVLVVPINRKGDFLKLPEITSEGLKIGAIGAYQSYVRRHFPMASVISLHSLGTKWEIDAWFTNRLSGFIWCLAHPEFVTIDYDGLIGKAYFSYPVREGGIRFVSFLNNWMKLKELSGFQQRMNNYWLKGEPATEPRPRWSILRNVLHVGD